MEVGKFEEYVKIEYCPICDAKTERVYDQGWAYDKKTEHYFFFCTCRVCEKLFIFEYKEKKEEGVHYPSSLVSDSYITLELVSIFPKSEPKVHESVPDEIKDSYTEGVRCLNSNAPNGAVVMFRRTLQQICKNKGAKKKELKDQIDEVIPPELKETAHELRLWGNFGAHPDELIGSVSVEDATDLKEFVEKVLYAIYEYCDKISKKRAKRKP